MSIKAIIGYLIILIASFFLYGKKPANNIIYNLLPLLMVLYPVIVGYRVKLKFSVKDILLGIVISLIILLPYYLLAGGVIKKISYSFLTIQMISVAFPEEFFFRGFIQDSIGKNYRAIFLASILFSFAHFPKAFFSNDWTLLLSFFPSLVMGWLYMKTNNILPGIIFHFLANIVQAIKF
jgi:membrane protease YdiL (CAAX protease family)